MAGRTMAVANMACLLAQETKGKVLMIDWDIAGPALHYYFKPYIPDFDQFSAEKEGLLEYMQMADKELPPMKLDAEDDALLESIFAKILDFIVKVNVHGVNDNLYILKAGQFDNDYPTKANFDWFAFFDKIPAFFTHFAFYLRSQFDYVLIDSQNGHSEVGGICTMLMPEKLVLVFPPKNEQSIEGVLKLAKKAAYERSNSDDLRPLQMYPLASCVEDTPPNWEWKELYTMLFQKAFIDIYGLPDNTSMKTYFTKVKIMYNSKYSFGEKIAVLEQTVEGSFQVGYRGLLGYLKKAPWRY